MERLQVVIERTSGQKCQNGTCGERAAVGSGLDAGDNVLVLADALQEAPLLRAVAPDGVVPVPAAGNHLPLQDEHHIADTNLQAYNANCWQKTLLSRRLSKAIAACLPQSPPIEVWTSLQDFMILRGITLVCADQGSPECCRSS